jgi:hypothetical protein
MRRFSLKLVGLLATAAAGAALGTSDLAGPEDAAARERPAVEWGGMTHTTQESLEAWLTDRGFSYAAWAYQHPIAALRLEQAAERAERASTTPPRLPAEQATGRRIGGPLLALVVALGVALSIVAVVLSSSSMRFHPSLRFASDRRAYLALVGVACVAAGAATYVVQV